MGNFHFAGTDGSMSGPRSAYPSERPFTLFAFAPRAVSFLSTSAVSLAHICPPVVFYHLVHLGVSLFLSRPPASCFVSCTIPPSLSPSACCQNPLHQSQTLSPQKHLRITSISLSPQELSFSLLSLAWPFFFDLSVYLPPREREPFPPIYHFIFLFLCTYSYISSHLYSSGLLDLQLY